MPVRPLTRNSAADEDFRRSLLEEMRAPQQSGEPDVMIDDRGPTGGVHLFVVRSRWAGLDQIERSRIILEAYEDWKGEQEALKATVAMGLTPGEAKAMGMGQ